MFPHCLYKLTPLEFVYKPGLMWGPSSALMLSACSLLTVIPHSLKGWKNRMLKCSYYWDFQWLSHIVNWIGALVWAPSPLLTSGLDSEPDRHRQSVWLSHPPNGSLLFHKNFQLEKILHSNREEKRREKSHDAGPSPILAVEKPLESRRALRWPGATGSWRINDNCLSYATIAFI